MKIKNKIQPPFDKCWLQDISDHIKLFFHAQNIAYIYDVSVNADLTIQ